MARIAMALYGDLTYDNRVRKEARSLAAAGHEVTVVCIACGPDRSDLPARVRIITLAPPATAVRPGTSNAFAAPGGGRLGVLRARIGWLAGYVRGLRAWGRRAVASVPDASVWHAHDLTGLAAIAPSLPAAMPLVYDSHELFLEQGVATRLPATLRRLLRWYEKRLVHRAAAVITVNDEIAAVLRRLYGPARIEVVSNCPDRWPAPATQPDLLREAAGIPSESPVVLYHGALIDGRGIDSVLGAMRDDEVGDAHLVLMGYGDWQERLTAEAEGAAWRGRLHILPAVAPAALLPWVASADVGVMVNPGLTLNDQFSSPNKLFECLTAGTPVVASDLPTIRRIILGDPEGPLGAICDSSQPASIASAIVSIVGLPPAARAELRTRCRKAADDRWNWETESRPLLSVYSALLPRA